MNTLAYLQFFEGLAEKKQGYFSVEKISSKKSKLNINGKIQTYYCNFLFNEKKFSSTGTTRKEALKILYQKLRNLRKKI